MIKYTKSDVVDIEKYTERIQKYGYVLVDGEMLRQHAIQLDSDSLTLQYMYMDLMKQKSAGDCMFNSREIILRYLKKYEYCPEHYFKTRKSKGESIAANDVLIPLRQNGYANEFISYYMDSRSSAMRSSKIMSLLAGAEETELIDKSGIRLTKVPFSVNKQVNLRFNYSNFDIISQIPKNVTNCIGVEDDYVLVWGDFAQSDFRIAYNLFMRSPENDLIMNKYQDKYEALARIVANELGEKFDKERFLEQRDVYKVNTLATVYGRHDSVVKENSEFIQMFTKFLNKCPKYSEYFARLKDAHELGLPIVINTYFGNEELSPILYKESDTVNRALNAPIQAGTSEIIILTVNKILDMFYDAGYSEEDISLYLVRHDEPVFKVKKSVLKDAWIFEQFHQILVDDWSPLELTFSAGYRYGEEDEDLMHEYGESVKRNQSKIAILTPGSNIDTEYYPTERVMQLHTHYEVVGDEAVAVIYDPKRHLAHSAVIKAVVKEEIEAGLKEIIQNIQLDSDYRGVVVKSYDIVGEDFNNGLYFVYKKISGSDYANVSGLCQYVANVYCKNVGKECPVLPPAEVLDSFVKSVKKLSELG